MSSTECKTKFAEVAHTDCVRRILGRAATLSGGAVVSGTAELVTGLAAEGATAATLKWAPGYWKAAAIVPGAVGLYLIYDSMADFQKAKDQRSTTRDPALL